MAVTLRRDFAWFRSLKWGRSNAGACLWWICSPIGQFAVVDELRFQHADPSEVVELIRAKDAALGMKMPDDSPNPARYTAAEPKLWLVDRGPSIAELFARAQLPLMRSSDDRVQGWNVLSSLMKQSTVDPRDPDVKLPALVIAQTCPQLRRSLPLLREGKTNHEDLDANTDAPFVEALRIGAMSRPSATEVQPLKPGPGTMGHALEQARNEAAESDGSDYFG